MHPIVFEFKSSIDQYPLVGHLYSSSKTSTTKLNNNEQKEQQQHNDKNNSTTTTTTEETKINYVIINCATGIHQTFYVSFAKFLASQSENVIVFTYDYRGMGKSRKTEKPIQKDVTYLDFAKDFWGMLEYVKDYHSQHFATREMELTIVGHSIGAYLLMTCPPHLGKLVNRAFLASSYHAYFGYSSPFRNWESLWNYINVRLFFYSIPILSYWYNYFPAGTFWKIMEDLPTGVAKQWNYFQYQKEYMVHCGNEFLSHCVKDPNKPIQFNDPVVPVGISHVKILTWLFDDDIYGHEYSIEKFNEKFYGNCQEYNYEFFKTPIPVTKKNSNTRTSISVGHVGLFKKYVRDSTFLWEQVYEFIINGKIVRKDTTALKYPSDITTNSPRLSKL